jgi:hypothetical protein
MLLLNTQNENFFYLAEKDLDGHIYRIMCEEYVLPCSLKIGMYLLSLINGKINSIISF